MDTRTDYPLERTWEVHDDTSPEDIGADDGIDGDSILILIAHPDNKYLGQRFQLSTDEVVEIGRDRSCAVAFPEVLSLSRAHARLKFVDQIVLVEDLGSTNGTLVNDRRLVAPAYLKSGDRLQVGALHFKYLRAHDAEAAYHEAIHHLVMQDGLTAIGNRRKLDEELDREFSRATRHHRPLSLILFDVDVFKGVNDTQGHLGGDHVLKRIASVCLRSLRPEQVFARVGGDEFAILSPETRLDGAVALAEKLRAAVAEHAFDGDLVDPDLRVTCSFGCAEITGDMVVGGDLYDAADRALYRSKNAGRNRVSLAECSPA